MQCPSSYFPIWKNWKWFLEQKSCRKVVHGCIGSSNFVEEDIFAKETLSEMNELHSFFAVGRTLNPLLEVIASSYVDDKCML